MPTAGLEVVSRARTPLRARESKSTLSGWRVELKLPQGPATMVLADLGSSAAFYRAEGALLGATQERLAELWAECLSQTDPDPGFQQFG
jgi:hypothetical protein